MSPGGEDAVGAPEHVRAEHDLSSLPSGVAVLDDWLRRRALANEATGASRTYVVCASDQRVVGYYALASGSVALVLATGRTRRNMPDPVPGAILARLIMNGETLGVSGGFVPPFGVSAANAAAGIGISAAIGLVAGIIPATMASRLKIVDALRRVA